MCLVEWMKVLDLHMFYKFTKNFHLHNKAGSEQEANHLLPRSGSRKVRRRVALTI
jgi:hypothetical protein